MTNAVHTIIVVLGLPTPVPALIVRTNAILSAMGANKTTFPNPPIALAVVTSHVAALSSAEAAMKTRTVGNRQTRDDARKLVVEDCSQLHGYVQQLANASPTEASSIATQAAMTLRKAGAHPKPDLAVKQAVSGTIHVVAKSVLGARANEWQYSLDGGKSWTQAASTTKASTSITGITPGTIVQVRHRAVVKTGPGDWSSVASMAVS